MNRRRKKENKYQCVRNTNDNLCNKVTFTLFSTKIITTQFLHQCLTRTNWAPQLHGQCSPVQSDVFTRAPAVPSPVRVWTLKVYLVPALKPLKVYSFSWVVLVAPPLVPLTLYLYPSLTSEGGVHWTVMLFVDVVDTVRAVTLSGSAKTRGHAPELGGMRDFLSMYTSVFNGWS